VSEPTLPPDPLRRAFASYTEPAGGGCPPDESVWMAVARELPADQIREVVRHIAACGSCADAWRLAHATMEAEGLRTPNVPAPEPAWRSVWVIGPGLAAAALLVIGVLVERPFDAWRIGGPSAALRDAPRPAIEPLVEDGAMVDRGAIELRWSPGDPGARYDVRVATADLTVISQVYGLTGTAYTVPADAVAALPSGTRLFWQVTAVGTDQARITSPAFTLIIR
jgi:hypothetical protein